MPNKRKTREKKSERSREERKRKVKLEGVGKLSQKTSGNFAYCACPNFESCNLIKSVFVWTGENDSKTLHVDAKVLENREKNIRSLSNENGYVWTGPISVVVNVISVTSKISSCLNAKSF